MAARSDAARTGPDRPSEIVCFVDAADVFDLVEQMAGRHLLTPQVQFFVEAVLDTGGATEGTT